LQKRDRRRRRRRRKREDGKKANVPRGGGAQGLDLYDHVNVAYIRRSIEEARCRCGRNL
jgi:hypothetical protein